MKYDNDNKPDPGLTFISMFSGIEAASVAFGPLGWRAIAVAEIEKFPSAVLAHHYPHVPNVGDMAAHDWSQYAGKIDIVCGGPPCQAFSCAGLRESLGDARGNLSLEYVRAIHAIKPRNAITENVPGWLSTKDNAFGCLLGGLVGSDDALLCPDGNKWPDAGMVAGPRGRAAWRILDAQYFGLAQRRRRVIVVADFGNGADPAAVLFERIGLQGNPAPRWETRKDVAGTISARTKGGGGLGTDFDLDGGLIVAPPTAFAASSFGTFTESGGLGTLRAQNPRSSLLSYAPEIARCDATREAMTVALRGREGGATAELGGEVATSLRASSGGGDKPHVLTVEAAGYIGGFNGGMTGGNTVPTLQAQGGKDDRGIRNPIIITHDISVRRLTPTECERLMGFPDGYTNIPWRGRPDSPDGPRYKALGNSWAVPKFRWLGERIHRFMPPRDIPIDPAANDNIEAHHAAA